MAELNQKQATAFISYARADAKAFATKLNNDLKAQGITCWFDLENMESSGTFIEKISDAIEQVDYLILVNTPGAIESNYCQAEWQKALEFYKPIIPIVLIGDYEELPTQANIYLSDARDFREYETAEKYDYELRRLVEQLQVIPTKAGRLEGAPSLLSGYLERPEELKEVVNILTRHKTTVMTSITKAAGIQGMGGIGKTVLATALTRDYFIRRTFKDGVFWLTFGEDPNLGNLWTKLRGWLGGGSETFNTWEQARDYFQEVTSNKECLIILDDVWDKDHSKAFTRLGDKSRLLITSRFNDVIAAADAQNYELRLLSNEQALALLAEMAGMSLDTLPDIASDIAKACGNLPLAISMIGAMVRGRPNPYWQDALDALHDADLEEITAQFPEYPYPNLFASIQVSINALDKEIAERYYDFAIFPDDVDIPEDVPVKFWIPLAPRKVRKVLDELVNRNLLKRNSDDQTLSIHDLQLSFVRKQVLDIRQRHQDFLDRYNPDNEPWHTVADRYLLDNLFYHLHHADRSGDMLQTITSSPDWMHAKFKTFDSHAPFVNDIEVALSEHKQETPTNILHNAQLWAVRNLVNTTNEMISDQMLEAMILIDRHIDKDGVKMRQAFGYVNLRTNAKGRFDGLMVILRHATDEYIKQWDVWSLLEQTIDDIQDDYLKASALSTIASNLATLGDSKAHDLFKQAIDTAQSIQHDWYKAYSLSEIARELAKSGHLEEATEIAKSIQDGWETYYYSIEIARNLITRVSIDQAIENAKWLRKVAALSEITGELAKSGHLEEATEIAKSIQDDEKRAFALIEITGELAKRGHLEEATEIAHFFQNDQYKAEALGEIAKQLTLSEDLKANNIFDEALSIAHSIQNEYDKANVLENIVFKLVHCNRLDQALDVARSIRALSGSNKALARVITGLANTKRFDQALDTIQYISGGYGITSKLLTTIAIKLAENGNPKAHQVLEKAIDSDNFNINKAFTFRNLVNKLVDVNPSLMYKVSELTINIIKSINEPFFVSSLISDIGFSLAKSNYIDEAINVSRDIAVFAGRGNFYKNICKLLVDIKHPQTIFIINEILDLVLSIPSENGKNRILVEISPYLIYVKSLDEVIDIINSYEYYIYEGTVLTNLAIQLKNTNHLQAEKILDEAIKNVQFSDGFGGEFPIDILIQLVIVGWSDQAINIAHSINNMENIENRYNILPKIAAQLALVEDPKANDVFNQAIEIAQSLEDEDNKASALVEIATQLALVGDLKANSLFDEAIKTVRFISSQQVKIEVLTSIAVYMTNTRHPEAYDIFKEAIEIAQSSQDVVALSNIASKMITHENPRLHDIFKDMVDSAQSIPDQNCKSNLQNYKSNLLTDILGTYINVQKDIPSILKAFDILGAQSIQDMLNLLTDSYDGFEAIEQGLWYKVIHACSSIFAWQYPDYAKLEAIFKEVIDEPLVD